MKHFIPFHIRYFKYIHYILLKKNIEKNSIKREMCFLQNVIQITVSLSQFLLSLKRDSYMTYSYYSKDF